MLCFNFNSRVNHHRRSRNRLFNLTILVAMISAPLFLGCDGSGGNKKKGKKRNAGSSGDSDTRTLDDIYNLTVSAGDEQVLLTWNDPVGTDFRYISITWSPGGTAIILVSNGEQAYMVTGLTNSTEYTFTVKSRDGNGNVSNGVVSSATPFRVEMSGLSPELQVAGAE